jgi:hypothetical protein
MLEKSNGHIGFFRDGDGNRHELYRESNGDIYRAPILSVIDLSTRNRIGRWVCFGRDEKTWVKALLTSEKSKKASQARKERDQAYRDCGMVKVRGALGGTYYE